MTIVDKVQLNI